MFDSEKRCDVNKTNQIEVEKLLKSAFFDYEIDNDGDIYVKSGISFPFWINFEDDDLIKFFTFKQIIFARTNFTFSYTV